MQKLHTDNYTKSLYGFKIVYLCTSKNIQMYNPSNNSLIIKPHQHPTLQMSRWISRYSVKNPKEDLIIESDQTYNEETNSIKEKESESQDQSKNDASSNQSPTQDQAYL